MKKIEFRVPSERIVGVTIPENDCFYILDHDEVFKVEVFDTIQTELTDLNPYEFVDGNSSFIGLVFVDLEANTPILSMNGNTISYAFNPAEDFVEVEYKVSGKTGKITFATFSGGWFCASFSKDGRYIILAEPYDIALYDIKN